MNICGEDVLQNDLSYVFILQINLRLYVQEAVLLAINFSAFRSPHLLIDYFVYSTLKSKTLFRVNDY